MVYAVVRAGGRQEKVEVGTIVTMDRIKADKDGNVELTPGPPRRRRQDHLRREVARQGHGHGRGPERPPRPEDRDPEVQEQDRLQEAPGPPSGAHARQDHRHQVRPEGDRDNGTQEGSELHSQRSRLERSAPRREALRRPGRQRARSSSVSAARTSTPARAWVAAATTRCSPSRPVRSSSATRVAARS